MADFWPLKMDGRRHRGSKYFFIFFIFSCAAALQLPLLVSQSVCRYVCVSRFFLTFFDNFGSHFSLNFFFDFDFAFCFLVASGRGGRVGSEGVEIEILNVFFWKFSKSEFFFTLYFFSKKKFLPCIFSAATHYIDRSVSQLVC